MYNHSLYFTNYFIYVAILCSSSPPWLSRYRVHSAIYWCSERDRNCSHLGTGHMHPPQPSWPLLKSALFESRKSLRGHKHLAVSIILLKWACRSFPPPHPLFNCQSGQIVYFYHFIRCWRYIKKPRSETEDWVLEMLWELFIFVYSLICNFINVIFLSMLLLILC